MKKIRKALGFSKAKVEARKQWSNVLKTMKENYFQSGILYLAKLLMQWRNKYFVTLMSKTFPLFYSFSKGSCQRTCSTKVRVETRKKTTWGKGRRLNTGKSCQDDGRHGPGEEDNQARLQEVGSSGKDFFLKLMTWIESMA